MLPMILSIHFKVHMTNNMNSEDIHTQATLSHSCKSHPYLPGFLHCSLQSVCVSTSVVYVCRWSPQSFVLFRIKMPLKHLNSTLKLRLIKTHFSGGSVSFKSCMTHTWWRTVVVIHSRQYATHKHSVSYNISWMRESLFVAASCARKALCVAESDTVRVSTALL